MRTTENVGRLVHKFDYKVGQLFSTHLHLHLGALFKFVLVWDGVKEIFQEKTSFLEKEIYF